ncbi:unnamed protein product [Closterium sp. NIES-53]
MGPPFFNPCMASASLVPVAFLPVARPWRASVSAHRTPRACVSFCPSHALGVRRFSARRMPQACGGFCPSLAPGVRRFSARRAGALLPCFPSSPPLTSFSLPYFACSSLGWGKGGGGCWGDARVVLGGGCTSSAPLLCFVTKSAAPLRLSFPPLLRVQQWGGGYGGGGCDWSAAQGMGGGVTTCASSPPFLSASPRRLNHCFVSSPRDLHVGGGLW